MTERVRLRRLLGVFAWTGLTSLGGGRSAYFHHAVVVQRPWLTNREFLQDLTLAQLLPGPTYSNLAVALGVRLAGWRGGLWGAAALIVPGALILLALAALYFQFGFSPRITSVMRGMSAAVVALVFIATTRMMQGSIRRGSELLIAATMFVLVGPLRVNTVLAIVLVAPLSLWLHRPRGEG